MIRQVILFNLEEKVDPDEYMKWLLRSHIPQATRVPGVRKMVLSVAMEHEGQPKYRYMAEVYYDNLAALEHAKLTPEYQKLSEDYHGGPSEIFPRKDLTRIVFKQIV